MCENQCLGQLIIHRERRKKAVKEQVVVSNVKFEELEASDCNISADEYEEESHNDDQSPSLLDIVSTDIEKDLPSESEWEEEIDDVEDNDEKSLPSSEMPKEVPKLSG